MAALFLLLLAVTGGVLIAELVVENPTADQITLFHHTLTGYSEGWLLAIAAGLGALITLLLVASLNATKGRRVRRGQLRRRRRGLEHQMGAPEPDHARLLDEFFGPEQPSRHPAGPGKLAGPRSLLKLADPDWRSFSRWFDEWPVHGVASVGADGGGPG
jgi:hypothetical protein